YWVWSPTGRAVVVHRDVLGEAALVGLTSVDSFAVASPLPSPGAFQAPDVSASGRFVAYAARDALGERVVVVGNPERGGGARTFAQLEGEDLMAFAWRPGREQLSVQGATLPGYFVGPVVLLDAESGEARVVSEDLVVASFWSPDGRWLATLSLEAGGEDGPVVEGGPASGAGCRCSASGSSTSTGSRRSTPGPSPSRQRSCRSTCRSSTSTRARTGCGPRTRRRWCCRSWARRARRPWWSSARPSGP